MRIGDSVKITNPNLNTGQIGVITRICPNNHKDNWYVRFEGGSEFSWRESSLEVVESEEALAVRILGEDYLPRPRRKSNTREYGHDSKKFKIGDWVVIEGFNSYWDGCEAEVSFIGTDYCYLKGTDHRLEGYSLPNAEGAGFQSSLLHPIESEYNEAIKVLGEEYFA
jgi:hypothetical protein